jgi:hypothetical protein
VGLKTGPEEICLSRHACKVVDQEHASVRGVVTKDERANVVILGDKDAAIRVRFGKKRSVAGVGWALSRVHDIMAIPAKRAHCGGHNICVGEKLHLFRRDGQTICVGFLCQTRGVEKARVDVGCFEDRISLQNVLACRPARQHRKHHGGRNTPSPDNGLSAHLPRLRRNAREQILVFLGQGHGHSIA